MDNSAIKDKIIEIIEEEGFSSSVAAALKLISNEHDDSIWFGYEGFGNAAFMLDNTRVLSWNIPVLHEDVLTCSFMVSYDNNMVRFKYFNEDKFRKLVKSIKEKAVEVLDARKKALKERRLKKIMEL